MLGCNKIFSNKNFHLKVVLVLFLFSFSKSWGQATLPLSRTSWGGAEPTGWTNSGCTQRSTSFACSGSNGTIFDDNGDSRTVFFNSAPDQLVFKLKSSSMSGASSLLVQESPDGTTWTNIGNFGTASGSTSITDCGNITITLNCLSRYVKWTYTKSSGNCDMDDVSISSLSGSCSGACTPPATTITPTTQTLCVGAVSTISVSSSAASNTYSWQASSTSGGVYSNVVDGTPTGASYSGTNTAVLTLTAASTYYYRCLVAEGGTCTATSGTSTLVVISSPSITTQPSTVSATTSGAVSFSVTASGSGLTYQWLENGSTISNGGSNPIYAGATTSVLTLSNPQLSMTGYTYQCVISNACGSVTTTNTSTINVTTGPCVYEEFNSGTTAPSSWSFTSIGGTYTSAGNFGNSSPSLQMNGTGDRVTTISIAPSVATGLSFWLKGQGSTGSSLLVEGWDGTSWGTIQNITTIPTTGTTYTYNSSTSPPLPSNLIQFRFTYTQSSGNLSFDDVSVDCSANTITTGTLSATTYTLTDCSAAASGTVAFTSTGTFGSGNIYTVQLSNASGSFASAVNIGTLSSTSNSGTISFTIPALTASGSGYLIRIISSNPNIIGTSSSVITITLICAQFATCTTSGALGSNQTNAGCGAGAGVPCNLASIYSSYGTFCGAAEATGCSSPACITTTVSSVLSIEAGCTANITAEFKARGTGCSNSSMDGGDKLYITNSGGVVSVQSSTLDVLVGTCGTYPTLGSYTTAVSNISDGCSNANGKVNMVITGGNVTIGGKMDRGDEIVTYTISLSGTCSMTCPMLLPISLIDFYATENEDKNDIFWKVGDESNIKNYIIEKSEDGINYRELSIQKSKSNSFYPKIYTIEDLDVGGGIVYYRLSTVEGNWSIKNLRTISLDRDSHDWKSIIYQKNDLLLFEFKKSVPRNSTITLYDLSGKLLMNETINDYQMKFNIQNFVTGIYFARITTPYKTENFKIIIQNDK